MMIVNHAEALKQYLRDEYESQIDELLQKAKQDQEEQIELAVQRAKKDGTRHVTNVTKKMLTEQDERLATAASEIEDAVVLQQMSFYERVKEELEKKLQALPKSAKQEIAKKLLEKVEKDIQKNGYNQKDFTFYVWEGLDKPGAKATLKTIKVVAESSSISFESSMQEHISTCNEEILLATQKLIETRI